MIHTWTLAVLHVVLPTLSAWQFGLERHRYRKAMAKHMGDVLRGVYRGDAQFEAYRRPRKDRMWWVYMLPLLTTDGLLIWGAIEGALRHR